MQMEGVDGLHTVFLWIPTSSAVFQIGDEFDAYCRVLWEEGFISAVRSGVKFKLWDGVFFADGYVIERVDEGWATN